MTEYSKCRKGRTMYLKKWQSAVKAQKQKLPMTDRQPNLPSLIRRSLSPLMLMASFLLCIWGRLMTGIQVTLARNRQQFILTQLKIALSNCQKIRTPPETHTHLERIYAYSSDKILLVPNMPRTVRRLVSHEEDTQPLAIMVGASLGIL